MTRKKITNISQLANSLTDNYEKLLKGDMPVDKAVAVSNIAGKIITAARTQLQYNIHMKNKRRISFLESR